MNEHIVSQCRDGELLLSHEAAARLRIHPETFRRWLRNGKIRTRLKVGRGWRIPAAELERIERAALVANAR